MVKLSDLRLENFLAYEPADSMPAKGEEIPIGDGPLRIGMNDQEFTLTREGDRCEVSGKTYPTSVEFDCRDGLRRIVVGRGHEEEKDSLWIQRQKDGPVTKIRTRKPTTFGDRKRCWWGPAGWGGTAYVFSGTPAKDADVCDDIARACSGQKDEGLKNVSIENSLSVVRNTGLDFEERAYQIAVLIETGAMDIAYAVSETLYHEKGRTFDEKNIIASVLEGGLGEITGNPRAWQKFKALATGYAEDIIKNSNEPESILLAASTAKNLGETELSLSAYRKFAALPDSDGVQKYEAAATLQNYYSGDEARAIERDILIQLAGDQSAWAGYLNSAADRLYDYFYEDAYSEMASQNALLRQGAEGQKRLTALWSLFYRFWDHENVTPQEVIENLDELGVVDEDKLALLVRLDNRWRFESSDHPIQMQDSDIEDLKSAVIESVIESESPRIDDLFTAYVLSRSDSVHERINEMILAREDASPEDLLRVADQSAYLSRPASAQIACDRVLAHKFASNSAKAEAGMLLADLGQKDRARHIVQSALKEMHAESRFQADYIIKIAGALYDMGERETSLDVLRDFTNGDEVYYSDRMSAASYIERNDSSEAIGLYNKYLKDDDLQLAKAARSRLDRLSGAQ